MMIRSAQIRWLLVGILLLVFAAVKVAGVLWWEKTHDAGKLHELTCNVVDCTLPNGAQLRIQPQPATKMPFTVQMDRLPENVQTVSLSFAMRDMDMGFNRFDLKKQPDGTWRVDNVRLPLCSQARKDYLADIKIDTQTYRIPFTVP